MIRKLNFTNRIRIKQEDIHLNLVERDDLLFLEADLSSLGKFEQYELPPESAVFVEAYRHSTWMRFNFGCIKKIQPPQNCALGEFDSAEGIKFRVKVTSTQDDHRLLAEADSIRLENQEETGSEASSLLNVVPKGGMGDELYRVFFSDGSPELWVNNNYVNYKVICKSPEFLLIALPSIFREILTKIILIESWTDDDDETDWRSRWLKFAGTYSNGWEVPDPETEEDECTRWINDVVAGFSKRQKLKHYFKVIWSEGA